jgi:pre-mRNA-processing factor 8
MTINLYSSSRFLGFFMVPDIQMWNYNFIGYGVVPTMRYGLILSNPKDFYHEIHRVSHFIKFNRPDDDDEQDKAIVDIEDKF